MEESYDEILDKDSYGLLIDGEERPAQSGETFVVEDPGAKVDIAEVAAGAQNDIDRALESARNSLQKWQGTAPEVRGRILSSIADEIRAEKDRLSKLITIESGKPLWLAAHDVEASARYFEYYAGIADKIHGQSIPLEGGYIDYTVREPLGVTGHIIPWNFPLDLFGRTVAPALAAGNATVAKPAEQTPIATLEVGKLAFEAGLPPSVLNIVPGFGNEAGAALAGHPDVDCVAFTGSTKTGRQVAKMAVDNLNPVHIEAGGKNANVVFPDADFDVAIENTLKSIFLTNAGQACSAGDRLLLHEDIHAEFCDRLVDRTHQLSIGHGLDDPDIGPLVSREQYEKVRKYIDIGREEAGEPLIGGTTPNRDGYFVEPTIFDNVDNDTEVGSDEIFGPVLVVNTFSDEAEAVELTNRTRYGLVAGIFTSDLGRAHRFARDVKTGQVYINEWFAGGVETPFGGVKRSGFGREKGLEAVDSFTYVKNVCANVELG